MNLCPYCDAEYIEGADVCDQCGQPLNDMHLPEPITSVESSLLEDRVSVLNPKPPISFSPTDKVGMVLETLVERGIGCAFVVDDGKLVGVFSERDAFMRLNNEADKLIDHPVEEFMTKSPQTVVADAKIAFAVRMMDLGGYRHAPVVDADENLIGVISARDILRYLAEKMTTSVG